MNNNKETMQGFAEVYPPAGNPPYTSRDSSTDNRVMIYCRGMKVYIPDHFRTDALRKLLQVLKDL